MKTLTKISLIISMLILLFPLGGAMSQDQADPELPKHLHGKALKAKEASLEILRGRPERPFKRLAPLWASRGSMESTMKELRKQAAKIGADAVMDVRVKTQKMETTDYDPGWWGEPGWGGGLGPYGGVWGGVGYWGGYAQSHTYNQPVVTGWAIQWTTAPQRQSLEQDVEDAPTQDQ